MARDDSWIKKRIKTEPKKGNEAAAAERRQKRKAALQGRIRQNNGQRQQKPKPSGTDRQPGVPDCRMCVLKANKGGDCVSHFEAGSDRCLNARKAMAEQAQRKG